MSKKINKIDFKEAKGGTGADWEEARDAYVKFLDEQEKYGFIDHEEYLKRLDDWNREHARDIMV